MNNQEIGREGLYTPAAQPSTSTTSVAPNGTPRSDEPRLVAGDSSDDRAGSYPSTGSVPIAAPATCYRYAQGGTA